ncbi:MAG: Nramp family divalent metal transporter [Planctomycetota bacterium]
MEKKRSLFGPGFLVTAAFVGPGTIATASRSGSGFGYALLWAVLFSVVATIILQEMTARLGAVTGQGLGMSLRSTFQSPWKRILVFTLVLLAIVFGNTAYQAGNITGAATGLSDIFDAQEIADVQVGAEAAATVPRTSYRWWAIPIAVIAWALLMSGRFKLVQNVLIVLVVAMSALFIVAAIAAGPDWSQVASGVFNPQFPDESALLVVALVGTTVVPYNLFLHSSSVAQAWGSEEDKAAALKRSRIDAVLSIVIGGLITAAILVSAAVAFDGAKTVGSLGDIAKQLEPVLGGASTWVFGIGLLAAGLTSAITAPLAAAYAAAGCLGWDSRLSDNRFRAVFTLVIVLGLIAVWAFPGGRSPAQLVIVAQFANGLLLPVVSVFLLVVMNNRKLLGEYANGIFTNVLGAAIVLLTAGWGINQVISAIGKITG